MAGTVAVAAGGQRSGSTAGGVTGLPENPAQLVSTNELSSRPRANPAHRSRNPNDDSPLNGPASLDIHGSGLRSACSKLLILFQTDTKFEVPKTLGGDTPPCSNGDLLPEPDIFTRNGSVVLDDTPHQERE